MIPYQWTSMAIGLVVALVILILVRRDRLHASYAVWWLVLAGAILILAISPGIIDHVARKLGVNYPPIFLVVVGVLLIFIKMLTMDIARSRQERKLRRLAQRLAILEGTAEAPTVKQQTDHSDDSAINEQ
jgi:hypothetical protein